MRRKAGMAVAAAVLVGGWTWASKASEVAEVVVASEVRIVDAAGSTRIALEASGAAPTITFWTAEGKIKIMLGIMPDGRASMTVLDQGAGASLHLGATAITFTDPNREIRLMLGVNELSGYSPLIRSYNANGETIGN